MLLCHCGASAHIADACTRGQALWLLSRRKKAAVVYQHRSVTSISKQPFHVLIWICNPLRLQLSNEARAIATQFYPRASPLNHACALQTRDWSHRSSRRDGMYPVRRSRVAESTFAPSPWLKVLDLQPSLLPKRARTFNTHRGGATGAPSRSPPGNKIGEGTSPTWSQLGLDLVVSISSRKQMSRWKFRET